MRIAPSGTWLEDDPGDPEVHGSQGRTGPGLEQRGLPSTLAVWSQAPGLLIAPAPIASKSRHSSAACFCHYYTPGCPSMPIMAEDRTDDVDIDWSTWCTSIAGSGGLYDDDGDHQSLEQETDAPGQGNCQQRDLISGLMAAATAARRIYSA